MIGKNTYIWTIKSCFGGDAQRIASALSNCGFQSAILHEANLYYWRSPERIALAKTLRSAGIMPIGGAAVYGYDPVGEGKLAADICLENDLTCFVFDAETTWDARPAPNSNAVKLLQEFRKRAPGVKAGWCYWSFWKSGKGVSWYPRKDVIWAAQAENYGECDFFMPMMYWGGSTPAQAVDYLNVSWAQYREITDKPIIPIGRAYVGDGGTAAADAIEAFDTRARELGAPGVSWWSMQHALALTGIWPALCDLKPYSGAETPIPQPPPVVELTLEEKVERLWDNHPELH